MSVVQDANARFNALWDEIGAKRITIGDEEKGVEIVIDADLSIFNLIDKLKDAAQDEADKGDLSADEKDQLKKTAEEAKDLIEKNLPHVLRRRRQRLSR